MEIGYAGELRVIKAKDDLSPIFRDARLDVIFGMIRGLKKDPVDSVRVLTLVKFIEKLGVK